ncbi:LysR family transcriptional regulator [Rheinheimera sp.]|uniref:LysR family transcriptional regulator n=1 Tax=Rheinheimera sp. TaxID=1869214 RepID=UPI0037C9AD2A
MTHIFDDKQYSGIELFCLAAETGSFTKAALSAGITPAAVSRSISRLEDRLGVRLFVRTTRQIRLTDNGQSYYLKCHDALAQLKEAEREVSGGQATPSGLLRISAPTPYAHFRLLPLLPLFRQRYPDVQFHLHLGNRNVDFAADNIDLAIRMRDPKDSGLIARKLEDVQLATVAAPSYLRRAGTPNHPDDLQQHDCLQFELPSTGKAISWPFMQNGRQVEIETRGSYHCTDDLLGAVALAKHGAGIIQTYRYMFERELAQGELVELLPQYSGTSRPVYLLYPHARHMPLRLRVFIEFLLAQLRPSPTVA